MSAWYLALLFHLPSALPADAATKGMLVDAKHLLRYVENSITAACQHSLLIVAKDINLTAAAIGHCLTADPPRGAHVLPFQAQHVQHRLLSLQLPCQPRR